MLTIKDLKASKQLDSKEMAGMPAFALNLFSPVNAPKQAELLGLATSSTGPQLNTNVQTDNDTNVVIGSGQVINSGGNSNATFQSGASFANNFLTSIQ